MTQIDKDDIPSSPRANDGSVTIGNLIETRLSRRMMLVGLGASALSSACATSPAKTNHLLTAAKPASTPFTFKEIERGSDGTHHVPDGYKADVLLRWGDPIFKDAPDFNPLAQNSNSQSQQFGYNNDFIGFVSMADDRGLLCVNHEYSSTRNMFPAAQRIKKDKARIKTEIASQGTSIVEINRVNNRWQVKRDSALNRRITGDTPMNISGPAAGHARMKTPADPSGRRVLGTLGNCAGGITPWGTYLTAEENIDGYFGGKLDKAHAEADNHARMGVPDGRQDWHYADDRFNVSIAPNEANRFGWIVEIDPLDPNSTPKKRTALGRFKHEGAESVLAPDGRVVVYMGDDQRGDYLYKFVSRDPYNPARPDPDLLDHGTLHVARFNESGVDWLALTHGQGPLTAENGFNSQADVMISTRLAADALGATSMDRPEDVQPHPGNGRVYVMLTNNKNRSDANDAPLRTAVNAANPRADNVFGHIIEIIEPEGDFAATRSEWEFLVKCGNPNDPAFGALWNPATSKNGWFSAPDNCAVDPRGGLWIATDGNPKSGAVDGLWALETEGLGRGTGRAFFRAPIGAEVCGPRFTPDGRALFLSVQHPGEDDDTTYETPLTRWPDFDPGLPPRPSVVVIYRDDNAVIGV
ncbi:PhoX family phosphatase [Fretibacter rubidus]|uniref:PhoX family protein n=1 Tax=Fretibacter rubidus TaxID=570162 RepID=UPI00352A896A